MKDSQYITHDIGARNDPKLVDLQMAMGGLGLGIWWCLVEMLWEQDGYLPLNFRSLAYSLKWAKAKDVERVVTEFGLFENDGTRFWNRSALERINHKRRISEARAVAGREGGISSSLSRSNCQANAKQLLDTPSKIEANAKQLLSNCQANAQSINKLNNKLINQDNNISLSASDNAEKKDIYRLFFFKNFKYPEKELQRFLDRYEGNWTRTGSTVPEKDHMRLARSWKPENTEPRFADPDFLPWLKTFAAWVAGCGEDPDAFIAGIKGIRVSAERRLTIIMNTPELRDRMNMELGPKMTDQDAASLIPPYRSLTIASHV